ncbi:MAG TPA: nickel pincer cofactor biosynthesis protein LarC [Candidatus Hydrogenedentes bacterium]|nr:nickel pincer cofactor biosynthesis protein LarC [Candidatus Hydrogenedentota bacterium]HQE82224.1 nickel pincer cofactor biosynthesis protein LarC [Candidatus Hydrogenedentota bacterium]HQM48520.1 nickel pincer cofactor biosynthesis protein LarC [Candidatus Hydrogenedentota bacterium]
MKILYFDCVCGAAGDMIAGALIDAGADFAAVRAALGSLPIGGFTARLERVKKKGIEAAQFKVEVDPAAAQPHRHLRHVLEIIESAGLPQSVKDASAETFQRIAGCEAEVHGTTIEKVHFHEVGAIDSIVDVIVAHLGLHLLGIERVESSPLPVGFGTVKAAHGVMPVPAPATAKLLQGVPIFGGELEGEWVTPTGAALIAQLAQAFGPIPAMRLERIGYGSGMRDAPDRANVLRALVGRSEQAHPGTETILVLETNIDDMNPELLPVLIQETLQAGAHDAFLTPIVGKKGRAAHKLTVLSPENRAEALMRTILRNSTTLGVRMRRESRICLPRDWKTVSTPWGQVRVKYGLLDGEPSAPAPEFEDCRALAEKAGVTVLDVYQAAVAAAIHEKE